MASTASPETHMIPMPPDWSRGMPKRLSIVLAALIIGAGVVTHSEANAQLAGGQLFISTSVGTDGRVDVMLVLSNYAQGSTIHIERGTLINGDPGGFVALADVPGV